MAKSSHFSKMKFFKNEVFHLLRKSMDWFLYDIGLRHERVKDFFSKYEAIIIGKLHLLRSESKVSKHHSSSPVNLKA